MKTSQTFNVLCATIRSFDNRVLKFHLATDFKIATLVWNDYTVEKDGVACSACLVQLDEKTSYPLRYVRSGLDGGSVVLAIDQGGMIVELYTDTPVPGSNATPDSLRKEAKRLIDISSGEAERLQRYLRSGLASPV